MESKRVPVRLFEERLQTEIERGEATAPDATVKTDHGTLLALAHRRLALKDALLEGDVVIEGDKAAVKRFLGLFTMPEPFARAA